MSESFEKFKKQIANFVLDPETEFECKLKNNL